MTSLLPWIGLVQGAALAGWLFGGAVLRGGVATRLGIAMLAAIVLPGAIFLKQMDFDGYLAAFIVIGSPVAAGAIVVAILPICWLLEARIGYRFR